MVEDLNGDTQQLPSGSTTSPTQSPEQGSQIPSGTSTAGDLLDDLDDFKPSQLGDEGAFNSKVELILGVLNIVGSIVSVITIMIIGFKYMLGSVEDKASYKKVMIPWIIGAVLVFTVTTIPNMLFNIGTSLSEDKAKTESMTPPGYVTLPIQPEHTYK